MKKLLSPLLTVKNPVSGKFWNIPAVMPGPMEGVMKWVFCSSVAELGLVRGWMTPFIRISTTVPKRNILKKFLRPFVDNDLPVIVQLLGSNPDLLLEAVHRLIDFDIAGIDMNFACPSKRVVRHNGGGGLLGSTSHMNEILQSLRHICVGMSLSAKIRTGITSSEEMKDIIPAVCEGGIDFLSVHYRTVNELYSEVAGRRERMSNAVELSSVPVVGSGDVYGIEDVVELCDECGCSGVMGARGWLKNPLLLNQIYNYAENGEYNFEGDGRELVFRKMCDIAKSSPAVNWSRSGFLEMAAFMWGAKSQFFQRIKELKDDDIMSKFF